MAVSLNTKAIYKTKANLFNGGLGFKNGDILIGDRAFEFYNHQNPESYLQIPWEEIKLVRAHVMFKGRFILIRNKLEHFSLFLQMLDELLK